MKFDYIPLSIPDVLLIRPIVWQDERGFFMETYQKSALDTLMLPEFVQDNHSRSKQGVLRGLHFQRAPYEQGKLVRCIHGRIWDVAVDLRPRSNSYGSWVSALLGEEIPGDDDHTLMYIPPGFAHGFLVLTEYADVMYKTTVEYAPEYDDGLAWNDPTLGIPWPMENPIVSAKDAGLQSWQAYISTPVLN